MNGGDLKSTPLLLGIGINANVIVLLSCSCHKNDSSASFSTLLECHSCVEIVRLGGGAPFRLIVLKHQLCMPSFHNTNSLCMDCLLTLSCLLQPFSAALVSHEITHASWPTRPSKRKAMNCPVYPKSTVSKIKKKTCAAPHPGTESSSQINSC